MFIVALFAKAKNQPQYSSTDTEYMVYISNGVLFIHKEE
jgi:hypothetical protein